MTNAYIIFENNDFTNQHKDGVDKVDKVFTSYKKARNYIIQDIKERYDENVTDYDDTLSDVMESDYRMLCVTLNKPNGIPQELNVTDGTELIDYEP